MKRPLLSVKELAAHLRVSDKTVRRARRKGVIPSKIIGRQIWFDWEAVRRAMRQAARDYHTDGGRADRRQATDRTPAAEEAPGQ
jgi:excisionase family DNA binding protein